MFYKTNIDICNDKQMFHFLKEHFRYDTMNSWNRLQSIANNVKIYNLNLDGDCWVALSMLNKDNYFAVNMMIEDWEDEHPNYKVGFNGRSGGYLVLYNKNDNQNVLPDYIVDGDYEDYKQYIKDYYGTLKDNRSNLRYLTELVRDFDKLCDDIRDYVNELSKVDVVNEVLTEVVENFNEEYEEDMDLLEIDPLKVVDNKIDIKDLSTSKIMSDMFIMTLRSATNDLGFKIVLEDTYLTIKER